MRIRIEGIEFDTRILRFEFCTRIRIVFNLLECAMHILFHLVEHVIKDVMLSRIDTLHRRLIHS